MSKYKLHKNQEGLVAMVVAAIIMTILSLITLGFTRLMQDEQRRALDRSLSTQAFYAAESAINEAIHQIRDGGFTADKTTCDDPTNKFMGTVDNSLAAKYSCLLIDQAPDSLEYTQGSVGINTSKVIPLHAENNSNIGKINISWEQGSGSSTSTPPTFSDCTSKPKSLYTFGAWPVTTGMLRLDVIPADTLNRDALISNTISMYLYPCSNGGVNATNYSEHDENNEKGKIVYVSCAVANYPRDCSLDITMGGAANKAYYLRVKSVYKASDMTIRVYDVSTNTQQPINGAQVLIDSTGKVNDVIRRIQVRVPTKKFSVPEYVLETTDSICKQLQISLPSTVTNGCLPL